MRKPLTYWLPEIGLAVVALFFIYRELGTFPAPWIDDGFYMIIAKNIAAGRGYSLPVLTYLWEYPPLLAVGPTLLWPVGVSIKLLGFSVAAARLSQTFYLLATCVAMYVFTKRVADRSAARWTTALLISLSTFVNTGKPLLGEVPGFFFLTLGLLAFLTAKGSLRRELLTGVLFGLSVVTKLTYGVLYPALGVAWIAALVMRDRKTLRSLTVIGCTALLTFVAFNPWLRIFTPEYLRELHQYGLADGGSTFLNVLRNKPDLLLRFQYLYFGALFIAAAIGLWTLRLRHEHRIVIATLTILLVLYFLNERGWYRHLLAAHLLLLPFVPSGTRSVIGKYGAAAVLLFCIVVQGWWQFTHKGSPTSDEVFRTAEALQSRYAGTDIVITQPEVFSLLPENPRWLLLSDEIALRTYPLPRLRGLPLKPQEHCHPILRKMTEGERDALGKRVTQVYERYYLIAPPKECGKKMKMPTI